VSYWIYEVQTKCDPVIIIHIYEDKIDLNQQRAIGFVEEKTFAGGGYIGYWETSDNLEKELRRCLILLLVKFIKHFWE
jgi:hypothetical protein